jgi:transposase
VDRREVTHQRLLRAMDVLADEALSVVFYDLTTLRAEGASEVPQELRAQGLSKEGGIARQVLLGVVQTAEGLPIAHRVWQGSTAESTTLQPALQEVLAQWPVRRMVLVADRGLLSLDNLAQLQHMVLPTGQALEFILAVPGRRYAEFAEVLQPLHEAHCTHATQEVIGETTWQAQRLVWAHDPQTAAQQTRERPAAPRQAPLISPGFAEAASDEAASRRCGC